MRLVEQAKYAAYRARLRQRAEVKKLRAQNAPLVSLEYQLAVRGAQGSQEAASLSAFAYSSRSFRFRDVLSLTASNYRLKFGDLRALFRLWNAGQGKLKANALLGAFDREALATLAQILVNQQLTASDLDDAWRIYSYLQATKRKGALGRDHRLLALEAEIASQSVSNAQKLAAVAAKWEVLEEADQLTFYEANSLIAGRNPAEPLPQGTAQEWLRVVNTMYQREGLLPLDFSIDQPAPSQILDSLGTEGAQAAVVEEGPLVSVIMPAFRPDEAILTSARTTLNQTYRNLELIVVDDGSGDQFQGIFSTVAQMDPRVKVIHAPVNAGTYTAMNIALAESRGEYVTVQGDDDWSHGQKIERLIEYLEANPELPAVTAPHVRFNTDGFFTRIAKRAEFVRHSYAAIVYRRSTFELLGPWQSVRKAGDSEHFERLEKYTGRHLAVVGEVPTSFSRVSAGRLTVGEVDRGHLAPDRRWYVSAYRHHFDRHPTGGESLATLPAGVPTGIRSGSLPDALDVLFCTDFTCEGEQLALVLSAAKEEVENGRSVGFATLESPLKTKVGRVSWDVLAFLEENKDVAVVQLNRPLKCLRVEVYGPGGLAFADGLESWVEADTGCIVIGEVPEVLGKPALLNLHECGERFAELFGPTPDWSAPTEQTRRYAAGLGFDGLVDV